MQECRVCCVLCTVLHKLSYHFDVLLTEVAEMKLPPGCNGQPAVLDNSDGGQFTSPGFNSDEDNSTTYQNDLSCSWLIRVQQGSVSSMLTFMAKYY